MTRFARSNGLTRSKISGLGPKPPNAPTPSTSKALTPVSYLITHLLFMIIVDFT